MDLPLFLRDGFRFVFAYKKESRLILRNFRIIYFIFVSYFSYVHNYTPDWLKLNSTKISERRLFHLEIYNVKLQYAEINFVKAIFRNPTLPLKMEITLVYTEGNLCKDTHIMN